ncbi:unnamed protein product [Polarella glacialis]|uniref:Uncharacterized protein n=1 Tax=Polarella glacialis TaxID=89957 RepID=A0A813EBA0_POLGL|nr:unnamed protein product [Polarella glacialis]
MILSCRVDAIVFCCVCRFACLLSLLLWLLLILLVSRLSSSLLLLLFLLLVDLFGRHIGPNVCEKDQNGRWLGGRGLSLILSLFAVAAALLLSLSLRRVHRS